MSALRPALGELPSVEADTLGRRDVIDVSVGRVDEVIVRDGPGGSIAAHRRRPVNRSAEPLAQTIDKPHGASVLRAPRVLIACGGTLALLVGDPQPVARSQPECSAEPKQGSDPCYDKGVAKVTSKLQVTIPKRIADRYGIRPGDEIDWLEAGDAIRVLPGGERPDAGDSSRRLELFDAATARQRARQLGQRDVPAADGRGWTREDLYERGSAG